MLDAWALKSASVRVAPCAGAPLTATTAPKALRRPRWNARLRRYSHSQQLEEGLDEGRLRLGQPEKTAQSPSVMQFEFLLDKLVQHHKGPSEKTSHEKTTQPPSEMEVESLLHKLGQQLHKAGPPDSTPWNWPTVLACEFTGPGPWGGDAEQCPHASHSTTECRADAYNASADGRQRSPEDAEEIRTVPHEGDAELWDELRDELRGYLGSVQTAQQALMQARDHAATEHDETFRQAEVLCQHDAERRSAVRSLLIRMARSNHRMWEAQAAYEQELGSLVDFKALSLHRRLEHAQADAERRKRELLMMRLELQRSEGQAQNERERHAADSHRLHTQHAASRVRFATDKQVLTCEMASGEEQWATELAGLEMQLEMQWTFACHKTDEMAEQQAELLRQERASAEAALAAVQADLDDRDAQEKARIAGETGRMSSLSAMAAEFERQLKQMKSAEKTTEARHQRAGEHMQGLWQLKEVEAGKLRAEVRRLQKLQSDALAASWPHEAYKLLYAECLKLPIDNQGKPQSEGVSFRASTHNFATSESGSPQEAYLTQRSKPNIEPRSSPGSSQPSPPNLAAPPPLQRSPPPSTTVAREWRVGVVAQDAPPEPEPDAQPVIKPVMAQQHHAQNARPEPDTHAVGVDSQPGRPEGRLWTPKPPDIVPRWPAPRLPPRHRRQAQMGAGCDQWKTTGGQWGGDVMGGVNMGGAPSGGAGEGECSTREPNAKFQQAMRGGFGAAVVSDGRSPETL